jgi:uncharacterized membrane protein
MLMAAFALAAIFPLLFGQLMLASFAKLHLTPSAGTTLAVSIIIGGLINIPVKRFVRDDEVEAHVLSVFGLSGLWPELRRTRRETVIAVNVGGCVIPTGLAVYEIAHLLPLGLGMMMTVAAVSLANVAVCYHFAQPVANVGIALPGLLPPVVAAALALLLAPDHAAPVAFVAGVAGPLVGADLLHLKDIRASPIAVASIGGAGTFDGIVLSGIVAAYLA